MWRDFAQYLKALGKQWVGLATGPAASLVLLVVQEVFHVDIPRGVLGLVALAGLFVAGFLAWREERAKVAGPTGDPEMELRRPQFEKAVDKLSPGQAVVVQHVLRVGDADGVRLRDFFTEQGRTVSAHDADLLLTTIAETTGLLEVRTKGNAFGRYAVKPVWQKLLVDWATPAPVDRRIADGAEYDQDALRPKTQL
jgi:hypothetical protein